jgi:Flp pilus assembly CpaF family ATPase
MRPERLIYGELRGAEVMRILDIIGFGHDGSMMTMHALDPEDARFRIEAMCLMANLGLGLSEIRYRIATTIDVIITLLRLPDGIRRMQITEAQGLRMIATGCNLSCAHEDTGVFEITALGRLGSTK